MIYNARDYTLYISNGTDVLQYNAASGTLLDTISFGGSLLGLDINSDCSQIAVADNSVVGTDVSIHLLDTQNHSVSDLLIPAAFMESGTYSVVYTPDDNLVSTSDFSGSGWVPLRHIDINSGTILYEDSVRQRSMLSANPDHSLIAFSEANSSGGPYGIYGPNSIAMVLRNKANAFLYDIAIDRTSSFLAIPTYAGLTVYDTSGTLVTTIPASTYGAPLGVAYSPVNDLLYVSWENSSKVTVFNSLTRAFVKNITIPYSLSWHGNSGMDEGHIKISADGKQLFIQVPGGIYSIRS